MHIRNNWPWMLLTVIFLGLDLFTKSLAQQYLKNPMEIIPNVLQLVVSYNPGIAFSLPMPNVAMIILTPVILAIAVFSFKKHADMHRQLTSFCLVLLMAGGLGNLMNRIAEGSVIDFIDFSFWPSFNLADTYLTIAALLIILFHGKIFLRNH